MGKGEWPVGEASMSWSFEFWLGWRRVNKLMLDGIQGFKLNQSKRFGPLVPIGPQLNFVLCDMGPHGICWSRQWPNSNTDCDSSNRLLGGDSPKGFDCCGLHCLPSMWVHPQSPISSVKRTDKRANNSDRNKLDFTYIF